MTVLVTGYEPFGDFETNPSARLAEEIDGETIAGNDIVGEVVPVEYDRTSKEIAALIDDHEPVASISTGLAPGATAIRMERVGININDCAGIPDNAGGEPRNEHIRDGPAAYFSTLPCVDITNALLDAGIPARVSNTAGTHLCNNALYTTRHYAETEGLDLRSGFVHLPFAPEEAAAQAVSEGEPLSGGEVPPSLPLELQVEAVRTTITRTID